MPEAGAHPTLVAQARHAVLAGLRARLDGLPPQLIAALQKLAEERVGPEVLRRRQRALLELRPVLPGWPAALAPRLLADEAPPSAPAGRPAEGWELVEDDALDVEILASRLALALAEQGADAFLLRLQVLNGGLDPVPAPADPLRPAVLARHAVEAWREAGLGLPNWRTLQLALHEALAEAYGAALVEGGQSLQAQGASPELDLRPLLRHGHGVSTPADRGPAAAPPPAYPSPAAPPPAAHAPAAEAAGPSSTLAAAMVAAQRALQAMATPEAPARWIEALDGERAALQASARGQDERGTVELVALLFQAILAEERLPASLRVAFARLQMPVLRVALAEPDFAQRPQHPARRLIDRVGACVMGLERQAPAHPALEREVRRLVQVVEAYPDTGRRIFDSVLAEFERFLARHFREDEPRTQAPVSLAQRIEQRETLAIQHTIELRRLLADVPVPAGVRDFLFHVWADAMASAQLRHGAEAEPTRRLREATRELVWTAGAKVNPEERAEVLRRLPALLRTLREGMAGAGLDESQQRERLQALNQVLSEAFMARAAQVPADRLRLLTERLAALETLPADPERLELDASFVLDLSGQAGEGLQVVEAGGLEAGPEGLAAVDGLSLGAWYRLRPPARPGEAESAHREEPVQLAWQGLQRRLHLFVAEGGSSWLFERQRLAAYLQAGRLRPALEESLTARAARQALATLARGPASAG